mgnify:CR=1 FL=1
MQTSLDSSAADADVQKLQSDKTQMDVKLRQLQWVTFNFLDKKFPSASNGANKVALSDNRSELQTAHAQTKERTELDMMEKNKTEKLAQIHQLWVDNSQIADTYAAHCLD